MTDHPHEQTDDEMYAALFGAPPEVAAETPPPDIGALHPGATAIDSPDNDELLYRSLFGSS